MDSNESYASCCFHDNEIRAFDVDRKGAVCRVELVDGAGKHSSVELFGVHAFRAQDLVMQNVVSRVLRSTAHDFSEDDIKYWVAWATSFSDTSSWLIRGRLEEWATKIAAGDFELVVFEPSIGAQIAVVCRRMAVRLLPARIAADLIQSTEDVVSVAL